QGRRWREVAVDQLPQHAGTRALRHLLEVEPVRREEVAGACDARQVRVVEHEDAADAKQLTQEQTFRHDVVEEVVAVDAANSIVSPSRTSRGRQSWEGSS